MSVTDGDVFATSEDSSILDADDNLIPCANFSDELVASVCQGLDEHHIVRNSSAEVTLDAISRGKKQECFVSVCPLSGYLL